ncbi:LOG family protein [Nocardia thailandica]|uniref:Cytokinin riboside 5'-monophosphate phosphoribohydrolase n=1 Tax=Nocardia thailandica TaxID=257275 RepID=A0ABW6PKP8_9NOCA|nr:TIGR00730 family Rossman fold protein [Nocardia thailandica]
MSPAPFAVCVYCSASTGDPDLIGLAARTGTEIARRGWQLVSGGGHVSMMGAVATAARAGGAHTVGVIPKHLVHREVADVEADDLVVTDTMRERKREMEARAGAFLTLPGGIGTMEELFETWTGGYLGEHAKTVVLLNHGGFYDGLLSWLDELAARRMVAPEARERLVVVPDLTAAFAALEAAARNPRGATP